MISIDNIFTFIYVVKSLSFSAVAKQLNISQPTVRRQVESLQQYFGKKLVTVNANSIEITNFGKIVFEKFQHYEENISDTISQLKSSSTNAKKQVKVVIPDHIGHYIVAPYLASFIGEYPEINLIISDGDVQYLQNCDYDIIISNFHPENNASTTKGIFSSEQSLYCTKVYAEQYSLPATPMEISQEYRIITRYLNSYDFNFKSNVTKQWYKNSSQNSVTTIKTSSLCQIKELLKSNNFIASLESFELSDFDHQDLITIFPEYTLPTIDYYLTTNNHKSTTKLFCEFLENCFTNYLQKNGNIQFN